MGGKMSEALRGDFKKRWSSRRLNLKNNLTLIFFGIRWGRHKHLTGFQDSVTLPYNNKEHSCHAYFLTLPPPKIEKRRVNQQVERRNVRNLFWLACYSSLTEDQPSCMRTPSIYSSKNTAIRYNGSHVPVCVGDIWKSRKGTTKPCF